MKKRMQQINAIRVDKDKLNSDLVKSIKILESEPEDLTEDLKQALKIIKEVTNEKQTN